MTDDEYARLSAAIESGEEGQGRALVQQFESLEEGQAVNIVYEGGAYAGIVDRMRSYGITFKGGSWASYVYGDSVEMVENLGLPNVRRYPVQRIEIIAPIYIDDVVAQFTSEGEFLAWADSLPWAERTTARRECFMSDPAGVEYTYGEGRGKRTYTSVLPDETVQYAMYHVNAAMAARGWEPMTGCFLNRYDTKKHSLHWHSDDFEGMKHAKSGVGIISFGEPRKFWWRLRGQTGVTPPSQQMELAPGSLVIMPPGMQFTHEHRIPKGDREMGTRVSLTFRAFK